MIGSYPWILNCVGTLYGQMAEVYLLIWTCVCMIRVSVCFVSFLPLIQQFTGPRQLPPYFRLILTFYYCLYEFLRDQELGTGRSPDTDKADSFHGQIRWAKLNVFAPDSQDVRELWAVRPHVILVKVISICRLLVFFQQYAADLQEEGSKNVLRRVSASPFIFDVTVSSTSGVITAPPEDLAREVLPLFTGVNILCGVNTSTPFVLPPALDIEWPVMQLHDFLTYQTPETRLSSLLISLSPSSYTLTPGKVFVVFVFAQLFTASTGKDFTSDG